jgi:hypothetical protein
MNNLDSKTHYIAYSLAQSLEQKYKAEIMAAKSTMLIYFTSSVGIGEHPQHLSEMDKQLEIIASAQDKLDALYKFFPEFVEE